MSEECPREIPWPTILFWMVCFALNSISQPTGRVLDLSSVHSSIVRSSPIICLFDTVNIMASFVIAILSSPSSVVHVRHAATRILLHRIVDERNRPDIHAIKSLKAQTRVRWVGFALGALPQFIKLFASDGVGLSQAFGAMYLISWLVFEIVALTASMDSINALGRGGGGGGGGVSIPFPGHKQLRKTWAFMAISTSAIIYSLPAWWVWLKTREMLATRNDAPLLAFILSYIIIPTGLLGFHGAVWGDFFWDRGNGDLGVVYKYLTLFGAGAHFGFPLAALHIGEPYFLFPGTGLPGTEGVVSSSLAVACVIGGLLVVFGYEELEWTVSASLMQIMCLVVQPLFYYGCMYDSVGTYMPAGMQWLG